MGKYLRLPSQEVFFALAFFVGSVSTFLLFYNEKPELIPQLWVSIVVAILSYWASTFTAEKLRLDLFDRRFEIYSKTLTYCSAVLAYASLERREENKAQIDAAVSAAHDSFRGIGYHKTRALFGADIADLFKQLNDSYAYIVAYGGERPGGNGYDAQKYFEHVNRTVEISAKLPDYFKPYVYFGDHKLL